MHNSSLKYKWDNENVREYELKLAKKERDYAIASKMKNLGYRIEDISIITGLSEEEIENLK